MYVLHGVEGQENVYTHVLLKSILYHLSFYKTFNIVNIGTVPVICKFWK